MENHSSLLKAIQHRVASSYGEGIRTIPEKGQAALQAYKTLPPVKKAFVTGMLGAGVIGALGPGLLLGSVSAIALQALGLAGFALGQIAVQNKEHRHLLALASLSTTVLTAQTLASGDNAGAAMLGHASLFLATCATLPEDGYKKLRLTASWAMAVSGAYLSWKFSHAAGIPALNRLPDALHMAIDNIPTATILVNAYAFSRPDSQTARARLLYPFLNAAHGAYFATRADPSAAILLTEALYFGGHIIAAHREDIVKTDLQGKPLPWKNRLGIYFRHTLWNNEDRSAHGLTPGDLSKKSAPVAKSQTPA